MPLHVQCQVVRAREAPATGQALEGLGTCVLAVVPGQLVGAGEAPVTAIPGALVGLFTCVSPLVCLQVGALGIHFCATWVITVVDPPFLQLRVVASVIFEGLHDSGPLAEGPKAVGDWRDLG